MSGPLTKALQWSPLSHDDHHSVSHHLAASKNGQLHQGKGEGASAYAWMVDYASGPGVSWEDVKKKLKEPQVQTKEQQIEDMALDFSRAIANSCVLERMSPAVVAGLLDKSLADPVKWAKDRPLKPLRKLFSPGFLNSHTKAFDKTNRQVWLTSCGRFSISRTSHNDWHVQLETGGPLVVMAREGIGPELWREQSVTDTQNRVGQALAQIGPCRRRQDLLTELEKADGLGMIR